MPLTTTLLCCCRLVLTDSKHNIDNQPLFLSLFVLNNLQSNAMLPVFRVAILPRLPSNKHMLRGLSFKNKQTNKRAIALQGKPPQLLPNSRESWLPPQGQAPQADSCSLASSICQLFATTSVHSSSLEKIYPSTAQSNTRQNVTVSELRLQCTQLRYVPKLQRTEMMFSMTYASCPPHPAHDKHSSQTSLPSSHKHLPIWYFCSIAF